MGQVQKGRPVMPGSLHKRENSGSFRVLRAEEMGLS